jgi:hypothetical protein
MNAIALRFSRVVSPVEDMEIWNASSNGYSFVISYESPTGPGFHGRAGYLASWITGSPFKTFDEAEAACDAMLKNLTSD